jgi:ATP-dependent DNA helicase RecG
MSEIKHTQERDIALVNELLEKHSEHTCVEFKHNNDRAEMIGTLCSALSNAARIEQQ